MVFVALLRGINVGGNNTVEMPRLRALFEQLGFTGVRTFINSGNVVFRANATDELPLARQIEAGIEQEFGFPVSVLVVSEPRLAKITKQIPAEWVNDKLMKCDVMFLWPEIDSPVILEQLPWDPALEDVIYVPGAAVWRVDRANQPRSRMTKIVGTKLSRQLTVRNPNTVRKLLAIMAEA